MEVLKEILQDRGVLPDDIRIDEDEDDHTFSNGKEIIYTSFFTDHKTYSRCVDTIMNTYNNQPMQIIMLHRGDLTNRSVKQIDSINGQYMIDSSISITCLYGYMLMFNISKHKLQPNKIKVIQQSQLPRELKHMKLPVIYHDDPIAKYFGLRPKEILKYSRSDRLVKISTTYRECHINLL